MSLGISPLEIVSKGAYNLLTKADHWERVFLSEIAYVQNGFAFKSSYFDHVKGVPLVRIRDISMEQTEHRYFGTFDDRYLIDDADILIGMDGDFTASRWKGGKALLNQRVCKIGLTSHRFDERFLFLCLQPFLDAINIETSSVTVKHLSSRTVEQIPLPLPPLAEQRRIVAKVEELFSELDKGVESLKQARRQLAVYRQSVLEHAFEGKLTAQWRTENKDKLETPERLLARIKRERKARYEEQLREWEAASEQWHRRGQEGQKPKKPLVPKPLPPVATKTMTNLPPLPDSWRWVRIGEIGLVGTGVTPLKSKSEYYVNGDVAWVTSGALNDRFVSCPTGYVTTAALNETNLRVYPKNTLVIALYGEGKTRGKCSELLIDATTNQAIAAIVQEGIQEGLRGMLKWFLTKNYEKVRIDSSGGVQPNLNLGIIANNPVPVCSIGEAAEIEKQIEKKFSQADELEEQLVVHLQQTDVLRQSILKRAFSGHLVPQDPNDEPASVLLDRIKAERKQKAKSRMVRRNTRKKRDTA